MKRRSALKTVAIGTGLSISGLSFATFLSSCKTEAIETWTPAFLSLQESKLIAQILDTLLPKTETPGAKELGIIQIVDNVIHKLYKQKDQLAFKAGLNQLIEILQRNYDTRIDQLDTEAITKFVADHYSKLDPTKISTNTQLRNANPAILSPADLKEHHFLNCLNSLKQLGISSYFSNELIATEHLNYDPIPGDYNGCIPLSDVGNSWSL